MTTITHMVQELIASGLTQKQIADELDISQPVVSDIYLGKQKDIGYERAGKKLEALYKRRMKQMKKHAA